MSKIRAWRADEEFIFCFTDTNHEPPALGQVNFGAIKWHGHTYKFYLNHYFDEAFKYGDGAKS
jgi:hypothetical protein